MNLESGNRFFKMQFKSFALNSKLANFLFQSDFNRERKKGERENIEETDELR